MGNNHDELVQLYQNKKISLVSFIEQQEELNEAYNSFLQRTLLYKNEKSAEIFLEKHEEEIPL